MAADDLLPLESLPPRLADRLRAELRSDERLVWVGRPVSVYGVSWSLIGSLWAHLSVLFVCTGLVCIGLLLPIHNPAWALPTWAWRTIAGFVGLTLLAIVKVGLSRHLRNRRIVYAVTDRRAIAARVGWLGCSDLAYDRDALERMVWVHARLRPDGGGDILFEPWVKRLDESDDRQFVGLAQVADALRAVEQLLGREVVTEFVPTLDPAILPDPAAAVPLADLPRPHRLLALAALVPGERVIWAGRPAGRYGVFRSLVFSGCAVAGAAVMAGGLAAAGAIQGWVFPGAGADLFRWIGVGLVVLALLALVVAPLAAWWHATRTAYVVTDRRALVVTAGIGGGVRSFAPATLARTAVRRYDRAGGDIVFERLTTVRVDSEGREQRSTVDIGLLDLRSIAGAVAAVGCLLGRSLPGAGADGERCGHRDTSSDGSTKAANSS